MEEKTEGSEMTNIISVEEEPERVRRSRGVSRGTESGKRKASHRDALDQQFEIEPMKKVCKFCSIEVVTYVEYEMTKFFAAICLASLVLFGMLAVFVLPVFFLVTRSAVHRCSRCL